jgi:hypothetical protein
VNVDALKVGYLFSFFVASASGFGVRLFWYGRREGSRFLRTPRTSLAAASDGRWVRIVGRCRADDAFDHAGARVLWVRTTSVANLADATTRTVRFSIDDGTGRAELDTAHVEVITNGVRVDSHAIERWLRADADVEVLARVSRAGGAFTLAGEAGAPAIVVEAGAHFEAGAQAKVWPRVAWPFVVSSASMIACASMAILARPDTETVLSIALPPVVLGLAVVLVVGWLKSS